MNTVKFLSALPQFLILLPAAASCYLCVRNQMKYTPAKTAGMCMAVIVPYSFAAACIYASMRVDMNLLLLPSLVVFFFLYRLTVTIDLPRCLAIYIGVCSIETFPSQFAYAFDARLHPMSGAQNFSVEAALFQFVLACLLVAAFAYPALHQFSWAVENLNFPKIWYSTVIISSVFLLFNILAVPISYSTLHAGRMYYLFPMLEGCALLVLITFYVLFYQGARLIFEHARLKEHSQLLEMQSHQYASLLEHIRATSRLRHDFRHSVRLLASLAENNDIENIRTHLSEYENILEQNIHPNYCANPALNALFGYYHEMAVCAGITIDWNISLPQPLTVSELDMAALFGNLLDNSISGCLGAPETSRYFYLTSKIRNGDRLYIVSTNSFNGTVRKGKNGYLSTKHGGKGTGLASISAIAEKYDGKTRISNSEREFFVDVVLKI
ncbi:MAG: GHKL domain-containing protein [Lachnospiraceae bacterium]|nr:GHKL domain-containing protein [Lachnospiraceae bacterium]